MTVKQFTAAEVTKHNTENNGWIIVDDGVYDVSSFLDEHPGGKKILQRVLGKDASKQFWKYHNEKVMQKYASRLKIGSIGSPVAPASTASAKPASQPTYSPPRPKIAAKLVAEQPPSQTNSSEGKRASEIFGELIPFAEPAWYTGMASPYYNETHQRLRKFMRGYMEEHINPHVFEWEEAKQQPKELFRQIAKQGFIAAAMFPLPPKEYMEGIALPAGIKHEEWDGFHDLVFNDEFYRCAAVGLGMVLIGGCQIGLPPIIHHGSEAMKKKIIPACLKGEKRICLAITEPSAGSDVAGLTTTAVKSPDGKYYIVNGEKKWITGGLYSDYLTTAVRTGSQESGSAGLSALLIEANAPGVTMRRMHTGGAVQSMSTYFVFEDVKVPVENLIGKENEGFKVFMANFNHERLGIAIQSLRMSRICLEDTVRHTCKRFVYGKPLIEQPVVRYKLANMARMIESQQAWLESLIYQSKVLSHEELQIQLGGVTALAKAQGGLIFEHCASTAVNLFGGLGLTKGGQGERVERLWRDCKIAAIPGGSEEVLLDLAMRQQLKIQRKKGAKI